MLIYLVKTFNADFAPTQTKLTIKNNKLYWIIFGHPKTVQCYELNFDKQVILYNNLIFSNF